MELIVFDLDGTLLNSQSTVSEQTRDTLAALTRRGIAYTVATGRTLHGARDVLEGCGFRLPQIFKNGVLIWNPDSDQFSHQNFLTHSEIEHVLAAILAQHITPFIFTLERDGRHAIYHTPLQTPVEEKLVASFTSRGGVDVLPAAVLPADAEITNISAIGELSLIHRVERLVDDEKHLVAYAGTAIEGDKLGWIDIHHSAASKGGAVSQLKADLGFSRVICFGDSDNDLSMFALADEAYAPSNAKPAVRAAATEVIGHHDEDGIAEFLRKRFSL
jgi:Cof subfamily protein (haloacid dehalogenase superfamily)